VEPFVRLFSVLHGLYAEFGLYEPNHFTWFGMAPCNFLAEDEGLTGQHFKTAPARWDQLQGTNRIGKEL